MSTAAPRPSPALAPPDDAALLAAFAAATLDPDALDHRAHVRLAWLHLRGVDFAAGATAFRAALRRYVAAVGAADRYHETITWAYLSLVAERSDGEDDADSHAFLARCPELLDHAGGPLARRYDLAALLKNSLARRVFVLPPARPEGER